MLAIMLKILWLLPYSLTLESRQHKVVRLAEKQDYVCIYIYFIYISKWCKGRLERYHLVH